MAMRAFFQQCPETAQTETIVLRFSDNEHVPDGDYDFVEFYCDDLDCNCQRVVILVIPSDLSQEPLAAINYGWESKEFYREWSHDDDPDILEYHSGAHLDPLHSQSEYAEYLLSLFQEKIDNDPAFVSVLRSHYAQFRSTSRNASSGRMSRLVPIRRKQTRTKRR